MKNWHVILFSILATIPVSVVVIFQMITLLKERSPFEMVGIIGASIAWGIVSTFILTCASPFFYMIYQNLKPKIQSRITRYFCYICASYILLTFISVLFARDLTSMSPENILHSHMSMLESYIIGTPYIVIFWTFAAIFEFVQDKYNSKRKIYIYDL